MSRVPYTIAQPGRRSARARPVRHRWFDPWLLPVGEGLAAVVATLIREIEAFERTEEGGGRRRRRRPVDQAAFETIVSIGAQS